MTLGSLFDGSGGFPLAGALSGIRPVWAAEVEPYPIAVTRSRLPMMQHLGSVTEVHGDKVQPVDVITFGSPCQDLSVAGKRAGIHEGQRSNLFFEAIRIIKEMRAATNGRYPTFAVWENVPGAFSSNQGEDFRCVLQEFIKICGNGTIPRPDKGKWKSAGEVVGDGYSVAWRQLDAQYWGVPQRRKRIYLVADFAGGRAGEILFEREGMQGHPAACGATGQGAAADAAGSAGRSRGLESLNPLDCQSKRVYRSPKIGEYVADCTASTIAARDFKSPRDLVVSSIRPPTAGVACRNAKLDAEKTHTLQAGQTPYVLLSGKPPRKYSIRRLTPLECCRLQGFPDGWGVPDHKDRLSDEELAFWQGVRDTCSLIAGKPSKKYSAETLTKWYNALHTDSAEYKMWGNGIALPCAQFVLGGVAEAIQERINNSHL